MALDIAAGILSSCVTVDNGTIAGNDEEFTAQWDHGRIDRDRTLTGGSSSRSKSPLTVCISFTGQ